MSHSQIRRGWREFLCEECKFNWEESTRDCFSHSKSNCPKCGEYCIPIDGRVDESLEVDKLFNLIKSEIRIKTKNLGKLYE